MYVSCHLKRNGVEYRVKYDIRFLFVCFKGRETDGMNEKEINVHVS